MKICIVGVGAIGGFLGTRLAHHGHSVSALARGATLEALRRDGLRLRTVDGEEREAVNASDRAQDIGVQDVVIIAVKGPALPALAAQVGPLIGPETLVVPAMNGVPWWFCHGLPGFEAPLVTVDPDGSIGRAIPHANLIGCVVHAAVGTVAPGVAQHRMGKGLIVGEPGGGQSERAARLSQALTDAGFDVTHTSDIRYEIWYKLWGNMTMNPVSAITGATGDRMLGDPLVRGFCTAIMNEASAIGRQIGIQIEQDPEARHAITAKLGAFKTSMLQDAEAGRPIELDTIVAAPREIAQRLGMPTPNIDALLGLVRLFGRSRGIYPE